MPKKSIVSIKKEKNIGSAEQQESTKITSAKIKVTKKNINDKQKIKVINCPCIADKSEVVDRIEFKLKANRIQLKINLNLNLN